MLMLCEHKTITEKMLEQKEYYKTWFQCKNCKRLFMHMDGCEVVINKENDKLQRALYSLKKKEKEVKKLNEYIEMCKREVVNNKRKRIFKK